MANTSNKQTVTEENVSEPTVQPVATQLYFLPEYGVSVEATSLEEAISLAKKAKGSK